MVVKFRLAEIRCRVGNLLPTRFGHISGSLKKRVGQQVAHPTAESHKKTFQAAWKVFYSKI